MLLAYNLYDYNVIKYAREFLKQFCHRLYVGSATRPRLCMLGGRLEVELFLIRHFLPIIADGNARCNQSRLLLNF